jgi:hypothetical protein
VGELELLERELVGPVALKDELSSLGGEGRHELYSKGMRYVSVRRQETDLPVVLVVSRKSSSLVNCYGVLSDPDKGELVLEFTEREGLSGDVAHPALGFIRDKAGCLHRLDDLPDDLHVAGDFCVPPNSVRRWPRRLVVDGHLSAPSLTGAFCDELIVGGRLSIPGADINELPRITVVGGDLFARHSALMRIRGDEKLSGHLILSDSALSSLPENFHVAGTLMISRTCLRELPAGLVVRGDLSCRSNDIKSLPEDISVSGGIWLADSKITQLPLGLECGGLDISRTAIAVLPERVHIRGLLQAEESALSVISSGCVVERGMELSHSQIVSLPSDLSVGGSLDLSHTSTASIPDGLRVGGDLLLPWTPIRTLPASLFVDGKLDLRYTEITRSDIPDSIEVLGCIYINDWATQNRRSRFSPIGLIKRLFSRGRHVPPRLSNI